MRRKYAFAWMGIAVMTTVNAQPLYKSAAFTIDKDKVTQGAYTAKVISPIEMESDYRNTNNTQRPGDISFRFLVNGEDVEFQTGGNHIVSVTPEKGVYQTPVVKFGAPTLAVTEKPGKMPVNTQVIFRLDMNEVLKDIREKRVFVTNTGANIHYVASVHVVSDFSPLLNKNFQQLQRRKEFRLTDEDGDGIYEHSILLSQWEGKPETKQWKLKTDIASYPQLQTDIPLVNALYNMSLEEMHANIEADTTFRTGALWGGVWTRDVSYSIYLGLAGIETEVAKNSLRRKVTANKRIVQDTGSGGAWPVSTDRVVWSLAAWEIYKVTQDKDWLRYAAGIIKNTLEDDLKTIHNKQYGLVCGESSFIDWRAEQSYPIWMNCADIFESMSLGTNVIYYKTYRILEEMLSILGRDATVCTRLADKLKTAINKQLWLPSEGYYAQYIYGDVFKSVAPRYECLGEAMAVLFDVADAKQSKEIMSKSPVTPYGATIVYPQMPFIPPYHNNGIWPFVQSYWNLAAAKTGNEKLLEHGLAAMYRPAALFLSNYENFVAESGDYRGTEINSYRMLWSIAGNLSTIYRIFFGMNFEADHLRFAPFVPQAYKGKMQLTGYPYAGAQLNITITGYGNKIKSFRLNGTAQKQPTIPGNLKGVQTIEIQLSPSGDKSTFNLVENTCTPLAPVIVQEGRQFSWNPVPRIEMYHVYCNGQEIAQTKNLSYPITEDNTYREFQVKAVDEKGVASYLSNPLTVFPKESRLIVEVENFAEVSSLPFLNYSGRGFAELDKTTNKHITLEVDVPTDGQYAFSARYSNGEGPINTENKCALRSLYLNDHYEGAIVMPQRGKNKWSDWGMSNSLLLPLKKGTNKLTITFDPHNENMNREVNRAMLDYVQLIRTGN